MCNTCNSPNWSLHARRDHVCAALQTDSVRRLRCDWAKCISFPSEMTDQRVGDRMGARRLVTHGVASIDSIVLDEF